MLLFLQYRGPPVAYIQQVLVKAAVSPWDNSLVPVDVFRSPLGRVFSVLEEIRNHVYTDRSKIPTLIYLLIWIDFKLFMFMLVPHISQRHSFHFSTRLSS